MSQLIVCYITNIDDAIMRYDVDGCAPVGEHEFG